ncbi:hypothetical protein ACFPJ1_28275 [Kribbella qitaiheensis]|uniref:hypothetical protein n=1 Tax=Kribbella qitaiheensis TaxID=1544730 RepID=UPI00360A6FC1
MVLASIVGWCMLARPLQRAGLTAPIVFVSTGFVLAEALGILGVLVLALLSHTGALLVDGNGFGRAGRCGDRRIADLRELPAHR